MRKKRNLNSEKASQEIISSISQCNPVSSIRAKDSDTTDPLSPFQNNREYNEIEKPVSLTCSSHITIRTRVRLTEKMVSLLLWRETIRVAFEGFSIQDYFSFNWMVEFLKGDSDIHEMRGEKSSLSCYLGYLVLLSFKDNWNPLLLKQPLDKRLVKLIAENFGDIHDRVYQSRTQYYELSKFLYFQIVDVEEIFERKSGNSVRYTSYCKGYGESGRSVRRSLTRYSYELDRDDSVNEIPEEFFSFGKSIHNQEDLYSLEQQIRRDHRGKT